MGSLSRPHQPGASCKGKSSNFSVEKEAPIFPWSPQVPGGGGQSPLSLSHVLQAADAVGEILLSLSYLPTAERLTVVVVKAKNLIWTNKTTAGEALLAGWARGPAARRGQREPPAGVGRGTGPLNPSFGRAGSLGGALVQAGTARTPGGRRVTSGE